MKLAFAVVRRSYAIDVPLKAFVHLLDSESHVTGDAAFQPGQETLCDKLVALPGVCEVEYDGHLGPCVFLTIEVEADSEAFRASIADTITSHLAWCAQLEKPKRLDHRRHNHA